MVPDSRMWHLMCTQGRNLGVRKHLVLYRVVSLYFQNLKCYLPESLRRSKCYTGELGYDGLNGTRKIGPSYPKSVVYIWQILDMHRTGTKHIVRHMQKSVIQWSVISKFTCTINPIAAVSVHSVACDINFLSSAVTFLEFLLQLTLQEYKGTLALSLCLMKETTTLDSLIVILPVQSAP